MDEQLFPQQSARAPAHGSASAAAPVVGAQNAQLTNLAARLKLAEERYANLVKRNQITEESLLQFERDTRAELRALTTQAVELRKHLQEINTKIDAVLAELDVVVKKHELSTVERYLDLWQPLQFVTAEQARRMVRDAVEQRAAAVAENGIDGSGPGRPAERKTEGDYG